MEQEQPPGQPGQVAAWYQSSSPDRCMFGRRRREVRETALLIQAKSGVAIGWFAAPPNNSLDSMVFDLHSFNLISLRYSEFIRSIVRSQEVVEWFSEGCRASLVAWAPRPRTPRTAPPRVGTRAVNFWVNGCVAYSRHLHHYVEDRFWREFEKERWLLIDGKNYKRRWWWWWWASSKSYRERKDVVRSEEWGVRSQKSEVRRQKSEVRSVDSRKRIASRVCKSTSLDRDY